MGLEFLRSCYRTVIYPFAEAPDVAVPVRWYFTEKDAQCLPFNHRFGSAVWDEHRDYVARPGEGTYPDPRPWANGRTPPWVRNDWFGAKADWQHGMALADAAGVALNPDGSDPRCVRWAGIPACAREIVRPGRITWRPGVIVHGPGGSESVEWQPWQDAEADDILTWTAILNPFGVPLPVQVTARFPTPFRPPIVDDLGQQYNAYVQLPGQPAVICFLYSAPITECRPQWQYSGEIGKARDGSFPLLLSDILFQAVGTFGLWVGGPARFGLRGTNAGRWQHRAAAALGLRVGGDSGGGLMPGTVTDEGADLAMRLILRVVSSVSPEVRLCNNFVPDIKSSTLSSYTEIGAGYTRWAPAPGVWFGATGLYNTPTNTFVFGSPGSPGEQVQGWYVVDTLSDTVLYAEMLASPYVIPLSGGTLDLGLQVQALDAP